MKRIYSRSLFQKGHAPLVFLFCLWAITVRAQHTRSNAEQELMRDRTVVDCHIVGRNAVDDLIRQMKAARWDSVAQTSLSWQDLCGRTQAGMRARILAFAHNNDTATATLLNYARHYLSIYYHYYNWSPYDTRYFAQSRERELGNYFRLAEFDSLIAANAAHLHGEGNLNYSQEIVLSSFAQQEPHLSKMIRRKPYRSSTVGQWLLNKRNQSFYNAPLHWGVKLGTYRTFQQTATIGYSPVIGLSLTSSLANPWIFTMELGGRIHTGTRTINYVAWGDTNAVLTGGGVNISVGAGYKIWENNNAMLLLKNDVGLQVLSTNLNSDNPNDDLSVETMVWRTGLEYNFRAFNHHRLGLELLYHYHPYQWDKDLLSPLGSNGLSLAAHFIF